MCYLLRTIVLNVVLGCWVIVRAVNGDVGGAFSTYADFRGFFFCGLWYGGTPRTGTVWYLDSPPHLPTLTTWYNTIHTTPHTTPNRLPPVIFS